MEHNLKIILEEFEKYKGQFILCFDKVWRLIAIGSDWDYYYILWDGRKFNWFTCVGRITPLKGYILEDHYQELIRMAKLNHYDQFKNKEFDGLEEVKLIFEEKANSTYKYLDLPGFFFFCRFGLDIYTAGCRLFVGMSTNSAVIVSDPSASLNILGFGFDAADSAITFLHNDGSGTAVKETIAGQPSLASNVGYDAFIFCKPNDSVVYFRLDDLNTGNTIIDSSINSELPVSTTMLTANALASNAALTPVNSVQIGINRIYVESDK